MDLRTPDPMLFTNAFTSHALTAALESLVDLSMEERSLLGALPSRQIDVPAGELICRAGDRPSKCFLVLEGFLSTSRRTETGGRQITAFAIPGDMPELQVLHLKVTNHDLAAITPCRLAAVEHSDLLRLCRTSPGIADALWKSTLVASSVFQEWIVNVGSRKATSRLAHLFCELMARLEAMGLARDGRCDLPLTQVHLGQATGLSRIHVNRSLQELRKQELITYTNGRLTIHDCTGLAAVGQFDPAYLHLPQPPWRS